MDFKLYLINRQLDLLCLRADHIAPGACRDLLIRRIERLNIEHHLSLARLLPSGASSDAPKPCDCDSRTVNRSSDSTRIGRFGVYVTLHLVGKKGNRIRPVTNQSQQGRTSKVDLRCALT